MSQVPEDQPELGGESKPPLSPFAVPRSEQGASGEATRPSEAINAYEAPRNVFPAGRPPSAKVPIPWKIYLGTAFLAGIGFTALAFTIGAMMSGPSAVGVYLVPVLAFVSLAIFGRWLNPGGVLTAADTLPIALASTVGFILFWPTCTGLGLAGFILSGAIHSESAFLVAVTPLACVGAYLIVAIPMAWIVFRMAKRSDFPQP